MSIQTEILDTIGEDGIEVGALRARLGNLGTNELNCAINSLLRAKRIRFLHERNRYEIILSTRPLGGMPHTGRPPNAQEEAAASLQPAISLTKPIAFRTARKPTTNGIEVLKVGHQTVNLAASATVGSIPTDSTTHCDIAQSVERLPVKEDVPGSSPGVAASLIFQRERDNRDVSTERIQKSAAVPETSGSYSRSDPSEDARTPARSGCASPDVDLDARRVNAPLGTTSKPDVTAPQGNAGERPAESNLILVRVQCRRQSALNRITALSVELENLSAEVRDCDQFMVLWERFAGACP